MPVSGKRTYMPKTLILEDGTEVEVPTEEELAELRQKSESVETLTKELEDLKQQAGDKSDPDWKLARKKMKTMEDKLKEQGKHVDDEGNIVENQQQVSTDEIIKKAEEAATRTATQFSLDQFKNDMLKSYNEEDRKVVEHYYTKLSAGEDLSFDKVRELVGEAARHITPSSAPQHRAPSGYGAPPIISVDAQGKPIQGRLADKPDVQAAAKEIFGDAAYTNAK